MWGVRVTILAVGTQQCILCVCCWARVTVRHIKILTVAQQCLYVKFMSPTTMSRAFCPVLHGNTRMLVCSFSFCRRSDRTDRSVISRGAPDQLCHCHCTRSEGITQSLGSSNCYIFCVCVSVLLLATRHAVAPFLPSIILYIVVCGPSGCTTTLHIISHTARFSGEKKLLNIECVFWFSVHRLYGTFFI
jgi:hypothetical protein